MCIVSSVTNIGDYAFCDCSGLTSVTIPNSVTSIGDYAFCDCSGLTSITIPNSVTSIGNSAFYKCTGLTSVTIGSGIKSIGSSAFEDCIGLTSVTIPDSVKSIGYYAFEGCYKLVEVITSLNITKGSSDYEYIAYYALEVHQGESKIVNKNGYLFYTYDEVNYLLGYTGNDTVLTLPENYNGESYEIYKYAFYENNNITSVTIPSSVTSIGAEAFYGCTGLESVYISDIAAWCGIDFANYYSNPLYNAGKLYLNGEAITELVIPEGVTKIPVYAFKEQSSITSVTIPNSVTSIGSSAFSGCSSLESITLPFVGYSVKTSIDNYQYPFGYIFGESSYTGGTATRQYYYSSTSSTTYTTYYIPTSLKSVTVTGGNILYGAFCDCSGLTSINIPNSVTSIGNSAFRGCSGLTSVTIPNSVKSIGDSAFRGCSGLTSVTIPNSVTSIGYYAFDYCSGLTSVTIPNSVKSIGDSAFSGCNKLVEVINKSSLNITKGSWDNGYIAYYALEVHQGESKTVNKNGYLFYTYDGINYLLGYTGNDTALTLPESYNGKSYKIYKYAFYENENITSVTIGNSVTSIGDSAFSYCKGLTSVTIGNSVTSIGNSAFSRCEELTSVTIPNSVTSIGYSAFYNCTGLTSITIPSSVTSIGNSAFEDCTGLTSITIPNSVTSIGNSAFEDCTGLTSITIPNSVTSIGEYAFEDCTGLTSITIPNSVTSIGYSAFYGCNKLVEVINKSSLNITKGSESNGKIAYNALEVHKGESKTVNKNGYLFYTYGGVNYLVNYIGNDTALTLPENYIINDYAFYYNKNITSITIPNSVKSIGNYAFYNCYKLTSVTIGNGVTGIGNYAFYNCKELTSVTIPDSVTSIGYRAFEDCTGLKTINYRGTETQWKAVSKGNKWNYNTGNYTVYYNYTEN